MTKKTAKKKTAGKKAESKNPKLAVALVLVVAAIIGAVALVMNVGSLAKMTAEKVVSATLGAPVTIASLDISLQDKQIRAGGVKIGNPAGYSQSYAATADEIIIAAERISQELLVFTDIKVTGTTLNMEVSEQGSNFTALREHARQYAAAQEQAGQQGGALVIIRSLTVEKATLNPGVILTGTAPQPVTLPDIRIRGIGEQSNGVPPGTAIAEIANYVVRVAVITALEQGFLRGMPPETLRSIQQQLGIPPGFMDQVRDLGDKVKEMFSE